MDYELIGHVFQMLGLFFAFLCVAYTLFFANITRGGIFSKGANYLAIGIILLAVDVFAIYAAAVTGKLTMIGSDWVWPALGLLTAAGFGMLTIGTRTIVVALGGKK
jgi:hypothetical protein